MVGYVVLRPVCYGKPGYVFRTFRFLFYVFFISQGIKLEYSTHQHISLLYLSITPFKKQQQDLKTKT